MPEAFAADSADPARAHMSTACVCAVFAAPSIVAAQLEGGAQRAGGVGEGPDRHAVQHAAGGAQLRAVVELEPDRRDTVHLMVNNPFKALSHPIRRGIVERLATGPATVGAATSGFGVSKPAISKHLKVLEETGVVTRMVEGRTHRLSLEPDALSDAADWMDRQRSRWERLFDVVDEYLKEEQAP
jgi:DNA-binding transcriptional ArsR family regulator